MTHSPAANVQCCIAGGGPAGILLGYLLARSGVSVIVLEKHADFLRDFRGDTIHPSTLQLLDELGLLDEVLAITDFRAERLWLNINGKQIGGPTFAHLKTKCKFIGFVPQWDFLDLITRHARQFENFELRMDTRVLDVVRVGNKVVGVRCESPSSNYEIRADLVVAADGRASTLRAATGQNVVETGVPIDALWFRLDRPADDSGHTLGWLNEGQMLITIPRRTHYQVAMVIRKGGWEAIEARGIESFRQSIGNICPPVKEVAQRLRGLDDVKLLNVQINHLPNWFEPGLLFIGDAAHAMSPVGGVGINLAVQDAVAAANHLVDPLLAGTLGTEVLQAIQDRRQPAARRTQQWQTRIHAVLFGGSGPPDRAIGVPWYAQALGWLFAPLLRRIVGYYIGIGFQPERIETRPAKPS
ncbi:MAG: FAD-dependent oxidoreductase [Pirellulales bacterium]